MSHAKKPASNRLSVLACILPMVALGACSEHTMKDYRVESDFITSDLGETQRHNKSIHIIDPSPKYSQNTQILSDGRRIERVVNQYSTGYAMPTGGSLTGSSEAPSSEGGEKGEKEAKKEGQKGKE